MRKVAEIITGERIAAAVPAALLIPFLSSGCGKLSDDVRRACEDRLRSEMTKGAALERNGAVPLYQAKGEIRSALGAGLTLDEIAFCLDLRPEDAEAIGAAVL